MKLIPLTVLFGCTFFSACLTPDKKLQSDRILPVIINDSVQVLTELKRGDILVKPNHNWLPGTVWVEGGNGFGHAAVVLEGVTGSSTIEVLSNAVIFESHARDVPDEFQLRRTKAYQPGTDFRTDNITFAPVRVGVMYRLRFNISASEIDTMLSYIERQDNGLSSWRSMKSEFQAANGGTSNRRTYFYCSHLIREAFLHATGKDMDANGGLIVYPNDLIGITFSEWDTLGHRMRF